MTKPNREADTKHGAHALAGPETIKRMREDIDTLRAERDAALGKAVDAERRAVDQEGKWRNEIIAAREARDVADCQLRDIREECAWVAENFKVGIISREDLPKYIAGHIRASRDSCVRCGHPKPCPDHFKGM